MLLTALTCLALAGPAFTAAQDEGGGREAVARKPGRAEYDALVEEYETTRAELREASREEEDRELRKRLRAELKELPVVFYARFSVLADQGVGLALVWMIDNTDKTDVPRSERPAHKLALFERLIAEHVGAEWFDEAVDQMLREQRDLGEEKVEALAQRVIEADASADTKAHTMYRLGELLSGSTDDAVRKRGLGWYDRLVAVHPDHELAQMASGVLFELKHLQIGMEAPDIVGVDLDGVEFKLSDYRGKVVMLDFWGDW